jgi:hypothetical protein
MKRVRGGCNVSGLGGWEMSGVVWRENLRCKIRSRSCCSRRSSRKIGKRYYLLSVSISSHFHVHPSFLISHSSVYRLPFTPHQTKQTEMTKTTIY